MRNFIIPLIPIESWIVIFSFCFFFGLIFLIMVIFNSMEHSNMDHDVSHDAGFDHGIDHDLSMDHDLSIDHDINLDHDVQLIHSEHLEFMDTESQKEAKVSKYLLGNITVFMLTFGATGLVNRDELSDLILIIGIIMGVIFSKIFAFALAKIAKSTENPFYHIGLGDEVRAVHEFDMKKKGVGNVTRRDGMTTTIITRGEYNTDSFKKGEVGYIIGKLKNEVYLVTKSKTKVDQLISKYMKKQEQ